MASHGATSAAIALTLSRRRSRHWLFMMLISDSAMFSQLPCLGVSYAFQEFYAHWLMYGALPIERTNSGRRHTARQALSAACSNAAASRYTRNDQ